MVLRLFSLAWRVSRFRFWIYTGGTYVVGYALGMNSWSAFFAPEYILFLLYFFLPANIFIYGVNDWWDQETDRFNPKKDVKEYRLSQADGRNLFLLLGLSGGISLALLFVLDTVGQVLLLSFLFLSYFYSAPPLRFKEVPFLDFSSNMLYIVPGILGYYLASGAIPPLLLIFAGYFHIAAMHLFSAIPDIGYDRAAGMMTTAVLLQKRGSLLLCLGFWSALAAIVILLAGFRPLSLLVLVYPAVPLALLLRQDLSLERVYWYLPYVNTSLGGLVFVLATLRTVS
ncbi:prenyltransferase [Methanoculleus sp. FWC-SCC1]|uniref:Prenyltransferase n=1 Tax=Methanoculleus frigidifontis TaxID=2584085 RepID=A0ABT8MA18_9EURY|nr:prenyltransferase [Methanoculleus sp. FWC-SCC1]MDN7024775.1 prenyltransferase [Methanoculleus sp. FWC-SCC1]